MKAHTTRRHAHGKERDSTTSVLTSNFGRDSEPHFSRMKAHTSRQHAHAREERTYLRSFPCNSGLSSYQRCTCSHVPMSQKSIMHTHAHKNTHEEMHKEIQRMIGNICLYCTCRSVYSSFPVHRKATHASICACNSPQHSFLFLFPQPFRSHRDARLTQCNFLRTATWRTTTTS